jgi:hypothetical protein
MKMISRMDKTALSVIDLHAQDPLEETRFWLSKPASKRWEAVEYLRQAAYGYDPTCTRLQRVLEVAERQKR